MLESHTKNDIEKISFDILKQSKSFGVFPTPIDKILDYSELRLESSIDLSTIGEPFWNSNAFGFKNILQKIRGLIDRREKIIYLDLSQLPTRQNFVKLHEIGHDVLPWQRKTLEFLDDDESLSFDINEQFEAEANFFASATLFQHDHFASEMKKYELGISASMQMAKVFGSSVHAALRRYVETSKKRCALIVLEGITPKKGIAVCNVKDYFQSSKFSSTFGQISWNASLGYTWPFVQDYYFGKRGIKVGNFNLDTDNGNTNFEYHFFFNSYNAFVFLFPQGEPTKTRTKIILTNTQS